MNTNVIKTSPIDMESRKKLGIKAGDTVRVWVKIQEKGKTRLQAFEGLVLARKHGSEAGATFTVRKVSGGVGVERTFPLYSPNIDKIEIVKRVSVRRSKLYHIREKVAREIRRQMRKMKMMSLSSADLEKEEERIRQEAEVLAEEDIVGEESNEIVKDEDVAEVVVESEADVVSEIKETIEADVENK